MIGFARSVRAAVQPCTPELWKAASASRNVVMTCAEIEDGLEKVRRGELDRSEFDELKTLLKKRLPIITPHATFPSGRRVIKNAVPSGLSLFDIDHISDPRGFYEQKVAGRLQQLGIVLAHVTPSTEGLRLVFRLPLVGPDGSMVNGRDGTCPVYSLDATSGVSTTYWMDLAEAQQWMARQLGLTEYDECCKDLARCSFMVPEDYVLFIDEEGLFGEAVGASHVPARGNTVGAGFITRPFRPEGEHDAANGEMDAANGEMGSANGEHGAANGGMGSANGGMGSANGEMVSMNGEMDAANGEMVSALGAERAGNKTRPNEPTPSGNNNPTPSGNPNDTLCYRGIPYAAIIRQWFALSGGEPVQGDRNMKLFQLAIELRMICDDNAALLQRIMPRYGLGEQEMRSIVQSALKAEYRRPYMSKVMRKAISNVQCTMYNVQLADAVAGVPNGGNAGYPDGGNTGYPDGGNTGYPDGGNTVGRVRTRPFRPEGEHGATDANGVSALGAERAGNETRPYEQPPALPSRLPSLIALLVSKTPDIYRAAVAHAVFPSLGAHLWRVRFPYIDGQEHEATLMNVLMAGTSAGKSCIQKPIRYIMADIRKRDEENRAREKAWKDEVNRKGSNKDKRERPSGLVIQQVNPDMTNPAFVMRMKEAEDHFLYANMNEIDQFDALRGSAKQGGQFQIMCLSFDPENDYGQDRVGTQSVTENVKIRFNWNASTTIMKCQRYFSRVLTDGPISRINFCTIPERPIGSDIPVYGQYDAAFEEELRPYIENLTRATGLIECKEAQKLVRKLMKETQERAMLSQSRVYENLSFRALVIAWLKACVLYVANGMKWEKTFEDFIRWSLEYDLYVKMQFFGDAILAAEGDTRTLMKTGPTSLLDYLPQTFTRQQSVAVRQGQGLDCERKHVNDMLRVWIRRGYIEEAGNDMYTKKK